MRRAAWTLALVAAVGAAALRADDTAARKGAITLFDGKVTSAWLTRAGKPLPDAAVQDESLNPHFKDSGRLIYTKERYGDFTLTCDFKVSKGCNSGIFVRVGDPKNEVQTGLEVQIFDSAGKETVGKHDCGALYDVLAPRKNTMKPAGEWNHIEVTVNKGDFRVALNSEEVVETDLDKYTEAGKNLDGSKNKYKRALKDFPREGHVALQDHGHDCWYKNIQLRPIR